MALRQHRETVVVPAARGTIVDRNGEPLAIGQHGDDGVCESAAGRRRARSDTRRREAARARPGDALPDARRPLARASSTSRARRIRARRRTCEALDFAGLGFYPEELRYYPQGPVAAQILGYAGLDNKGLEGLERSLEGTLAGQPGSQTIVKDPFGRALDVVETKPETPGRSVRLTIDRADPGERGGGAPGDGAPLGRARGDGRRDGSAHGRGARHGDGAALQREPLLDDARRSPAQPRGHGHVRAGLDLQARHGRRRRCRRGSSRRARRSASRRRSRSPTA